MGLSTTRYAARLLHGFPVKTMLAPQALTSHTPCEGGIRLRPRSRPRIGLAFEVIRQLTRVLFCVGQNVHQEAARGRISVADLAN